MVKVLQLSVDVGKCHLPSVFLNRFQDFLLTVALNEQLTASTSYKQPEKGVIDFANRLFIRLDKLPPETVYQCKVSVTAVTNADKTLIATACVLAKSDGTQWVELGLVGEEEGTARVELQFSCGMVEVKQPKNVNNRSYSFKSSQSQKQSSSQQNQPAGLKTTDNFHYRPSLAHTDSRESLEMMPHNPNISRQSPQKMHSRQELETSVATCRPFPKILDQTGKCQQTTTLLSMQIKIDQMEQAISQLTLKLNEVTERLQQTQESLSSQQKRNKELQYQRQELTELLGLQQLKNKIAQEHFSKINRVLEQMNRDGKDTFELINEQDQIVMLNQELEIQIHNKQNIIDSLKHELNTLKDKLTGIESKHTLTPEPSALKKLPQLPGKELEKMKSDKRLNDRKSTTWTKKQEDLTKQTNNTKESLNKLKEADRKKPRKESDNKPTPNKYPRDSKPVLQKTQIALSPKIPRGKPVKGLKVQQKNTLDTSKKSSNEVSLSHLEAVPANLMINSRSMEGECPSHNDNN